jgi:hypothetical protein
MWTRSKTFIASIPLFILLISSMTLAGAEPLFSVSPSEFTVHDAPPMGEPWTVLEKIVVWNRDNIPRLVFFSVVVPSEENVRPGYEPIPNENWAQPHTSSVLIEENSFAEVQISMDIPRWENLTGQKWEVWISAEREALPGEVTLELIVRMKIETTEELPPLSEFPIPLYIVVVVGAMAVAAGIGLLVWFRR